MADYKIPEKCNFDEIDQSYSSNSCSPIIIIPTFEGVLINAPKKISLSGNTKVPLACSFAFSLRRDMGVFEDIENAIVFTVVDKKNNIPYSGKVANMDHPEPPPDAPRPPVKREDLPDHILGGYVNLDVADVVKMPKKQGTYIVYATISNFKSNILEFEISK